MVLQLLLLPPLAQVSCHLPLPCKGGRATGDGQERSWGASPMLQGEKGICFSSSTGIQSSVTGDRPSGEGKVLES